MKIEFINNTIIENKDNEVTTEKYFTPRSYSDKNGNFTFHEDGLYSKRIFGKFDECECKKTKWPDQFCDKCGYRIISRTSMPNFYVSIPFSIPRINADYNYFEENAEIVKNICSYEYILFENEIDKFSMDNLGKYEGKDESILFGLNALIKLEEMGKIKSGVIKWYQDNCISNIPIPHTIYRPLIKTEDNKFVETPLGKVLGQLMTKIVNIKNSLNSNKNKKLKLIDINNAIIIIKLYNNYNEELFNLIVSDSKKSLMNQELLSQPITNAIRAVITNNYYLDEDILMIGKEFISTLYPYLFQKYNKNYEEINKYFIENDITIIVNRPPTIGQKSILAMKPRINIDKNYRFVISANPIIFDGLAADTDGDQFLIIPLYTKKSINESKKLLPSVNYIGVNDGKIRNKIPEDLMFIYNTYMTEEDFIKDKKEEFYNLSKDELENLSREKYIELYYYLGSKMWSKCKIPTISDIIDYIDEGENDLLENIYNFTNNKEKIDSLLFKNDIRYSNQESHNHMVNVNSSNNTQVAESGFFYKKLMSSTDDITITIDNCGNIGKQYKVSDIDKDLYEYKIKFSYITELNEDCKYDYKDFIKILNDKDLEYIHVRSILTCEEAKNRKCCSICAGTYILSKDNEIKPIELGIFSTLMITEHATQTSLDSMNKGTSDENVNKLLDKSSKNKSMSFDEVKEFCYSIIDEIGWIGVQSRFYEVALISRFVKNKNDTYTPMSLANVASKNQDKLGVFLYKNTKKNFIEMINSKEFEANSMKSQIMFDIYENID